MKLASIQRGSLLPLLAYVNLGYMKGMSKPEQFQLILGETIRASRKRVALSQAALAEKAGVSKRFLRDLEHGRTDVSVMNLLRIVEELNLSLSSLFMQIESIINEN